MALPVLAAIGGAMIVGGMVGTAASGALSKSSIGWADMDKGSNWQNSIDNQQAAGGQYTDLANAYMRRKGPSIGDASQYGGATLGPAAQYGGATIDPMADAASRASQASLAAKLTDQMNGVGPSLAQEQLKQGLAANLQSQQAAAASMRGGGVNASLAMRNLGDQGASSRQTMAGQGAMARLAEQQGAMSQLGGLTSSMRQQDFGAALAQAQMQQQAGLANVGARNQFGLAQAGFNQQAGLANMEALNRYGIAQYQGDLGVMGMNDQATMGALGLRQRSLDANSEQASKGISHFYEGQKQNYEAEEAGKKRALGFWGGLIGAGGNLMSMSDERMKTEIDVDPEPDGGFGKKLAEAGKGMGKGMGGGASEGSAGAMAGGGDSGGKMGQYMAMAGAMSDEQHKAGVAPGDPKLRSFYDQLEAHSYRYKNPDAPGAGEGRFVSPMAQELEKSELGKTMVTDTPQGKMVDYGKGLGAMLAGQAEFHDRLKRLESALAAKKGK